jgi:L-arabinose isomerase
MAADLKKGGKRHKSVREAARIELGLRAFLTNGNFKGFTTTFEDLHGLVQLPGLAPQRLMADGYGFAGEGDWKTAALVRAMKVMASGLTGGTSFMEDYTYHLAPGNKLVLGAHMLEICPSIADGKAVVAGASARHRRQGRSGAAGFQHARRSGAERVADGFRQPLPPAHQRSGCVKPEQPMPKLPGGAGRVEMPSEFRGRVRRVDLRGRRASHRLQPGGHHGNARRLRGHGRIEVVVIDADTKLRQFKQELTWNDCAYGLKSGWVS